MNEIDCWIVIFNPCDDYDIDGVFLSKEAAIDEVEKACGAPIDSLEEDEAYSIVKSTIYSEEVLKHVK